MSAESSLASLENNYWIDDFDLEYSNKNYTKQCKYIFAPSIIQKTFLDLHNSTKVIDTILVPENSISLFNNVISGDASMLKQLVAEIHEGISIESFTTKRLIDKLSLVVSLTKEIYDVHTINYQIYDQVGSLISELQLLYNEKNFSKAKEISNDVLSVIEVLSKSKKDAINLGLESVLLVDSGKKIGEMKLFHVK